MKSAYMIEMTTHGVKEMKMCVFADRLEAEKDVRRYYEDDLECDREFIDAHWRLLKMCDRSVTPGEYISTPEIQTASYEVIEVPYIG